MSVIVAVDESHASELAFARAMELSNGKELLVLCVQPDLSDALYAIDGGEGVAFAAMEAARKDGHEAAKKVLKKFAVLAGNHPCKFLLGHGDPAETICEEAKTRKVETIVVGRRALGSIQRWFTGSNSMKVVELADANVVIVHEK